MFPIVQPFLKIRRLSKTYPNGAGRSGREAAMYRALHAVSLDIYPGEIFALVGESGSGKTTLARCLLRFVKVDAGAVIHRGQNLLELSEREFRPYRRQMQMIFQNPAQALNPRQRVRACLCEPLKVYEGRPQPQLEMRIRELLNLVGLESALLDRLPAQLSGGQRQRVAIARALAVQPAFLVADEPTASLDALHRKQLMELLLQLRQKLNLTILLITHDLAMAFALADRVGVMHKGQIVEIGPARALQDAPKHAYSRQLLEAARARLGLPKAEI